MARIGVEELRHALGTVVETDGRRKVLVGFGIAIVAVYLLVMAVGWGDVVRTLERAAFGWVAVAALSSIAGLAAWAKAWQIVLGVLSVDVTYRKLVVTYFAATFANYVTPFGQVGGEPFVAYVLAKDTGTSYEEGFASVVTLDLLNLVPFFSFATVGVGYLALRTQLTATAEWLVLAIGALSVAVPVLVVAGWTYRAQVEWGFVRLTAPITKRTRISVEGVRARVRGFYAAIERVAEEPRQLVRALVFSYVGWVFFALPLYFAGLAIGVPLELLLVLFVVPASTLAGLLPLPGGLGGVEVALVVLLVAMASMSASAATAASLLYRLASYWFVLGVGGIAAIWVTGRV